MTMKEIWITLGLLFIGFKNTPQGFAIQLTDSSPSENFSSASIGFYDKLETTDKESSSLRTVVQGTTTTFPSQTKKQLSETDIASHNKANGFLSTKIHGAILPSLSTIHVAQSRTNVPSSGVLSTNVSSGSLATKYSLLNIPNGFSSGAGHIFAVSSKPTVTIPEIASTTSHFNGIRLPFTSIDKKYLSTSQPRDYSNGDNSQEAFTKSALSDLHSQIVIDQASQFSSANSILGRVFYTSVRETRLFTKEPLPVTKLPKGSLVLGSRTIWETTEVSTLYTSATILFFKKADTLRIHATKTFDRNMSTASTRRNYSARSGTLPNETKTSKVIDNNDFSPVIFSLTRKTQTAASSLSNSSAGKDISAFLSIVTPSASRRVSKLSSQTSSATMTISKTPVIRQPVTYEINSQLPSTLKSEFQTYMKSNTKEISSRDSSTFFHGLRKNTSNFSAESASISFNKTTSSVPQETIEGSFDFFSWAVSRLQMQSQQSRTRQGNSETSIPNSTRMITENFVAKTSANLKPSLQGPKNLSSQSLSSTKAEAMTEWRPQSSEQLTDLIFTSTPQENFLNTRTSHHAQISRSNSLIGGHAIPLLSSQVPSVRKVTLSSDKGTRTSVPVAQKRSFAATASYQRVQMSSESELQISHFPPSQSLVITTALAASSMPQVKSSSTSTIFQESSSSKLRTSSRISVDGFFSSSLNAAASDAFPSLHTKSSSENPQQRHSSTSVIHRETLVPRSTLQVGHWIHPSSQRIATEHFVPSSSHIKTSSLLTQTPSSASTVGNVETQMLTNTSDLGRGTFSSFQREAILHVTDLFAPSSSHIQSTSQPLQRKSTFASTVTYTGTPVSSASKIAQKIHSSRWSTATFHEPERFTPPPSPIQTSSTLSHKRSFAVSYTEDHISRSISMVAHQLRSSSESTETQVSKSGSEIVHLKHSSSLQHTTNLIAPSSSVMISSFKLPKKSDSSSILSYSVASIFANISEIEHEMLSPSSWRPVMSTRLSAPSSSGIKTFPHMSREDNSVFVSMSHAIPQLLISTSTSETEHQVISSSSFNRFSSTRLIAPSSSGIKRLYHVSPKRSSVLRLASSYAIIQSIAKTGNQLSSSFPEISVSSTKVRISVTSHMKSPSQMSAMGSSPTSEDQNLIPLSKSTMTTHTDESKLQTSSKIASPGKDISSGIVVPLPGEGLTSKKAVKTDIDNRVIPTRTRSSTATVPTVPGDISIESPTTVATDFGHIKLLIIVAIIPSIILCAFFIAVLICRRSRKRRNKAVYSIKLEYADESNGCRKRCVNSRLDLSLKGIHIDLEFPYDCERRGSYVRDSYSHGSSLSETQIRELQILSQECKENMEWISEVIAREMEASLCGRNSPSNRNSVYSVKEKENYEPSEKVRSIVRRESSKRGRETVKWRVPVVQRRDSEDFDQRDSICTEDTTLERKEGQRPTPRNCTGESERRASPKLNHSLNESADNAHKDKGLQFQLSNKRLDELQIQEKDNKENDTVKNKPLTAALSPKREDTPQVKRSSVQPRRFETL